MITVKYKRFCAILLLIVKLIAFCVEESKANLRKKSVLFFHLFYLVFKQCSAFVRQRYENGGDL
jgi:hypothetical protein